MRYVKTPIAALAAATFLASSAAAYAEDPAQVSKPERKIAAAAADAQRRLQQTFANLKFEQFGPSPIKGPIYEAMAGGRLLYFAPESEHLLFAAIYDKNGLNVTAKAEETATRGKLAEIDPQQALAIGPEGAPTVIEFTDPDCPYCRALDRFWSAKVAEGKPVRRLVYFVTGIHPEAAAKAEHILCSADREAAFRAIYSGAAPAKLETCAEGHRQIEAQAATVSHVGIHGTPTLIADGQIIAGFRQGEIEAFLTASKAKVQPPVPAQPSQ